MFTFTEQDKKKRKIFNQAMKDELTMRVGTDICSVKRVEQAYSRFGERFLARILTDAERRYALSSKAHTASRIAGRFAVKEAVSKALGVGWRGLSFKEIEVVKESSGKPGLKFHGRAAKIAAAQNLSNWEISISHEHEYAVAFVLAHNGR